MRRFFIARAVVWLIVGGYILCCLSGFANAQTSQPWRPAAGPLMTRWAGEVTPNRVLPEYPRPQLVREKWQSLNGLWDYALTEKDAERQPQAWDGRILVPFCIESALSGVMKPLLPRRRLWYRRTFIVPEDWAGQKVLLHFGAVDWEANIWVNGKHLGAHRGGYDSFSFDIAEALNSHGPQELIVGVWDPTDDGWQLRGKQTLHPGGAAYTACSGIWQTVWLEPIPEASIEDLKMVADPGAGVLHLTVRTRTPPRHLIVEATALDGTMTSGSAHAEVNALITSEVAKNLSWYKARSTSDCVTLDLPIQNARPWTPDAPFLYDLKVELKDDAGQTLDTVASYFGLRSITVGHDENGNTRPMLNGKPIMLAGALDQGYWPDGIYTAPTDEALRFDIEAAKKLGLAAVRKHLKIESERWYYWADKLGLLVLQDLPSGRDGDPFTDAPSSPEAATQCEMERQLLIRQRWNHPSIICWVMYNEGWGQHDTLGTARWAKALDPSRLIDEASGFPWHGGGDIVDCHGGIPPKDPRRISLDSETAGFGLVCPGHQWPGKPWATGTYDPKTGGEGSARELYPLDEASKRWYTRRLAEFYAAMWRERDRTGSSGDFKVQLYDVENESNGMLSYDRAVWKVDAATVAAACQRP